MTDTLLRFQPDVLRRRIVARYLGVPTESWARTAESFEEAIRGKTFRNPATGNKVQFGSLPEEEQKKLRGQWAQKHKDEEPKSDAKGKDEQGGSRGAKVPKSKPLAKPHEAARVGVGGKEVPPPPKKLPTFSNLREDEKAIESRMNSGFEKNPDGAAKAFLAAVEKDNWVFETDAAKNLLPEWSRPDLPADEKGKPIHPERAEFRGKYNAVLHQAANAIAKRAFVSRLDDIAKLPEDKRKVLVTSGGVACHGKGTPILMFDGSFRPVEEVQTGDLVMGPDSTPRVVQATHRGHGPMFRVQPKRGEAFTVNAQHVLSLKYPMGPQHSVLKVVNLTVEEVLKRGKRFRKGSFLYRTGVHFASQSVPLAPYFLGLWLGDGHTNAPVITSADPEIEAYLEGFVKNFPRLHLRKTRKKNNKASTYALSLTGKPIGKGPDRNPVTQVLSQLGVLGNKHIPSSYLINDETVRVQLLAGLLDTDGHYSAKRVSFEYITKLKSLADQICSLVRSLGFFATVKECLKSSQTGHTGVYYRLHIGGNDLDRIPTRIERKKAACRSETRSNGRACRNVLHTGYTLESLGEGVFYGFTLDNDHLYLLGDFTVTHNSGKGSALAAQPDLAKSASATWDAAGEQNATENEWVLEECQKRGIRPTFLFVHADPKQSWSGVVERAKGIGRMVDAQLFADSYAVGAKNFNDFHEKHKDKADFVFGVFQGRGQPAKITDKMPEEALKLDAHDVYEFASNYMDEKKDDLPSYIYDGATFGRRTFQE
jgi:hypothetical protein